MDKIKETLAASAGPEEKEATQNREKIIIRTSIVGIITNLFLSGFKAAVGFISGSIAIILDAVNNLSDAASSVITIIGTKLSSKSPDKKHPFGYGRIEYLTSMVISVIVLYAGITALSESVKKIITPETPDYSAVALIIVGVGVAAKIFLGLFVKAKGRETKSDALINSGTDALGDSVISAATLVAAAIYLIFHISLEAYLGAIISVVIIKSGIEMIKEATSKILGERAEPEIADKVKEIINSFDDVYGTYDLIFNDYGASRIHASVHIEVDDTINAKSIDFLTRKISAEVYSKTGVILTAISVYARDTGNASAIREDISRTVLSYDNINQIHGFYLDEALKTIQFDIVMDFEEKDSFALYNKICAQIKEKYPDYNVMITLDREYS